MKRWTALIAIADPTVRVDDRGRLEFRSDWFWRPRFGSQLVALMGWREQVPTWIDFMRPSRVQTEDLWMLTDALVGETVDTLRAARIAYVPFLVPTAVEVGSANWAGVGWMGTIPPANVDVALPASRLAAMFLWRRVSVIHLAPSLHGNDYYPQDGRWNAAGHRRAGEVLSFPVVKALAASAVP